MLLSEIAKRLELEVTVLGADVEITDAVPLVQSRPGCVTFLDDATKLSQLSAENASAVVLSLPDKTNRKKNFEPESLPVPAILAQDPLRVFAQIVAMFHPPVTRTPGIHPTAVIGENVRIGQNVVIHAHVCLMDNVQIGDDVTIFPNVTIYENCVIGNRCILHAGAVIGAYGFGYDSSSGEHKLASQLGNVVLEDDVEIGANTTIDRGTFGSTTIGRGTKIDNLVMVGHNCQIGRHNLLCSQVGIAGSTTTGDYVVMAGQVGVADHISIASQVILGAQAGVPGSISEPGTYLGAPATPISEMKRQFVAIKQLGTYWKTLKKLAKDAEDEASAR